MEDSKVTAANSVTEQHAYHTHHYLEHRRKSKSEGYGYSVSIIYAFIYVAHHVTREQTLRREGRQRTKKSVFPCKAETMSPARKEEHPVSRLGS